ncbi:MAG: zinc-binding metallopeptidase family protein [Pseudomonadota bacterium]
MPLTRSPLRVPPPTTPRAFTCRCGRPVFFRNSVCLACRTPLGYDPERRQLWPLEAAPGPRGQAEGWWRAAMAPRGTATARWRQCSNLGTASACNWLIGADDPQLAEHPDAPLCRACRLTRTLPDLADSDNARLWLRIANAQRRLVSTLIALGLPVRSQAEDPERGLAFDLLRAPPGGPAVVTGHANGLITLDVVEADDSTRERRRSDLGEPYRTLLGHLRHESGHYYWWCLVDGGPWMAAFREVFGDERADYAAALQRHHTAGPPPDWNSRHVSAYASCHPWEDWAETWAHYLHLVDTLDTARSFGLDGERVELDYERFDPSVLQGTGDPEPKAFMDLVNGWMELTGVLNELSRAMGLADFYPFVLSVPALRKLHLVHQVVAAQAPRPGGKGRATSKKPPGAEPGGHRSVAV